LLKINCKGLLGVDDSSIHLRVNCVCLPKVILAGCAAESSDSVQRVEQAVRSPGTCWAAMLANASSSVLLSSSGAYLKRCNNELRGLQ